MSEVNGTNSPTRNGVINGTNTGNQPPAATSASITKNPSTAPTPQKAPTTSVQSSINNSSAPSISSTQHPATPDQSQLKFLSSDLHQTKVATRENPFAEQNRQAAERKKRQTQTKKKTLIWGSIIGGVVIIIVIILILIFALNRPVDQPGPMIPTSTTDLINKAQDILNETNNIESAENVFNNAENNIEEDILNNRIDDTEAKNRLNELNIAKMQFYQNNNENDKVIEISTEINNDLTTIFQKQFIYNALYLAYGATGDQAKAMDYYQLMMDLNVGVE